MKSIRRSLNKDKEAQRPSFGAANGPASPPLPSSRAPTNGVSPFSDGKQPPKGIIQANNNYKSRAPQELSFAKGDFFHLVGERTSQGETWYEAANPMTGARGLVPTSFFDVIGKTAGPNGQQKSAPLTSQFGSMNISSSSTSGPPNKFNISGPSNATANGKPMAVLSKVPSANPKSGSLYGIVQYDFEAQRADELDAKKGEHIILIAQSNHEWFVAKPIGRLGGPGLIPVSFVEIMNMATGKPLEAATVAEMVRAGALPPVEEWKKSTAEYKQQSIPLGRFDFGPSSGGPSTPPKNDTLRSNSPLNSSYPGANARQVGPSSTRQVASHYDTGSGHAYSMDAAAKSAPALANASTPSVNRLTAEESAFDSQRQSGQSQSDLQQGYDQEPLEDEDYVAKYGLLHQASIESFHQEDGSFWFHMRCTFTSGYSLVLYRLYEDFYEFQIALMDTFRVEAGRQLPPDARPGDRPRRTLPMMPGPAAEVDEFVCTQRMADLTVYLADLCRLPDYIKSHPLFYDFLLLRPGDVEIFPPSEDNRFKGSQEAENDVVEYLDRMPGAKSPPAASSPYDRPLSPPVLETRPVSQTSDRSSSIPHKASGSVGYPSGSQPAQRFSNGLSPPTSATSTQAPTRTGGSSANPAFVKIKIFHRNTDDLIAIRVPPYVTFQALLDKVRERLGSDVSKLRWREDIGAGQARLVELYNDEDLSDWLQTGLKMVLYAD